MNDNKSKDYFINWIRDHILEMDIDLSCRLLYNYMSNKELKEFIEYLKDEGY